MTEPEPATEPAAAPIGIGPAVLTWAISWVLGMGVLATIIVVAFADDADDISIPVVAAASVAGWTVLVLALVSASRRYGTSDPIADYAVRFRPVDLLGVPLGAATQALVPLLYVPLRAAWPETFSEAKVEERARDLVDRASGWTTVVLVIVVVIGAPLVEELVYRGLLQRSAASVLGAWPALVLTSSWFAIIHFTPVLYPGLFLAGLMFGLCVVVTGRLGPAIVTHAAFNATGLGVALAASV